jgi:hypothetical protein
MSSDEVAVIEVDIATRIVDDNEDMYVVRPGASYSLYDDFLRENAVFLDFPDLPFSLEQKPRASTIVREIVTRSVAIRDWHLGKLANEPSRDQTKYRGAATGRRVGAHIGAIQRLYYELPVGTVLVIPSKSYIGDVLFVEITGPTERRKAVKAYPLEDMMVRPIRVLARKQKASLSPELRGMLGQPTPVMHIARSLRDEILKISFEQYVFKELKSTKFTTSKADFSTLDDLNIQMFNNYVAGLVAAMEAGAKPDKPIGVMDAIGYLRERRDLVPDLDQSIASPGFQRLYNDHVTPLVIGALMTAALSGAAIAQTTEIRVKNSAMLKGDPCAVQVEEQVKGSMRLAHVDEFKKLCEAVKETKETTGLATSMKVKTKTKK